MTILTIAQLTLRETARKKLLIALVILTVIVAILSGWAFHKLVSLPCGNRGNPQPCSTADIKLLAATLLILLMFMFSFVLAMGAAFVGAPTIANDLESGVALSMLPRPIRRSDLLLGKWLGLAVLIATYAAVSCGVEFVIGSLTFDYVPPHPILAIIFLIAEALTVLTVTILGSTRLPAMTSGIVVLILFGLTWMAGIAGAVGAAFHSQTIQNIGTISSLILPSDGLWRGAIYNLEPVSLVIATQAVGRAASGNPFFVYSEGPGSYDVWAAAWVVGMLALAIWSFSRREV